MNNTTSVIDLAFGVSQLSGNRSLYVSLLQKFAAEYQDLPVRLDHALAENRWHDVRTLVHTIKGVAGNLGCNALHEEARTYENAIRDSHTVPVTHHTFIDTLAETLGAIEKLADEYKLAGTYEYTWDAALYPSGVYLARLNINNNIYTQKLGLIK